MRRLLSLAVLLAGLTRSVAAEFADRFDALRAAATPRQLYAFLYDLPKGGDLHTHSGGSDRPEWAYAVLTDPARNGGDTFFTRARFGTNAESVDPTVRFRTIRQRTYDQLSAADRAQYVPLAELTAAERAAWCNAFRLDAPGEGRTEFFEHIWPRRRDVLQNLTVRLELLAENIKALAAEGVVYVEAQFGADNVVSNDGRSIAPAECVPAIKRRLAQPDLATTGVVVRFLDAVLRFHANAEAMLAERYAFVNAHRDLWVGMNLVGLEENGRGHPRRFLEPFRRLRAQYPGVALSLHAGEMDGADSHVRDSLLLGASRIGHGINLIHDSETLLLLQQNRRVLIEINLISNRLLEYVPDLRRHPFPEYLRTGIPVCLNTDDRGMWDSTLTDEYFTAVTTFQLSWTEIVQLGRNSLSFSFVQPAVKARLLADYDGRVAAFEAKYGKGTVDEALDRLAQVKPVAYGYAQRTWQLSFDD